MSLPVRMTLVQDKARIAEWLRRDAALHLYELGDLDDFFFPRTRWHGAENDSGQLAALALLYDAPSLPVLLAFDREAGNAMRALLERVRDALPPRCYAHLSPGLAPILERRFHAEPHGAFQKMALMQRRESGVDTSGTFRLERSDLEETLAFYARSYPGNWFDPRMLDTDQYFALREGAAIGAIAGVHVYSPEYRVAALGNIATAPELRGRGLATKVTARLCASLRESTDWVGLNVKQDNRAAIACYERLGFEPVAPYEEYLLTAK